MVSARPASAKKKAPKGSDSRKPIGKKQEEQESPALAQPDEEPLVSEKDLEDVQRVLSGLTSDLSATKEQVEALQKRVEEGEFPTDQGLSFLEVSLLICLSCGGHVLSVVGSSKTNCS